MTPYPRTAVLCLAVGQTLIWASTFYSFPALLVRWETELGWSKTSLTGAFTAAVATSALLSPLAGRLIDFGRGPHLLAGCAAFGGAVLVLLAGVEDFQAYLLLWLALGVANAGCLYEPCFVLVARTQGEKAQRAITIVTLFAGFAGTLSFPLGHYVSEAAGWRNATLVYAALALFVAAPLLWLGGHRLEQDYARSATHRTDTLSRGKGRYSFLGRPTFWLLAVSFALLSMNHGIVINHLLPLLKERAVPAEAAVLTASMVGPMQVFGRVVMMAVERYLTVYCLTVACFVSLGLGALALIGSAGLPMLLACFVVFQGSAAGVQSIMKPMTTRSLLGIQNFGLKSGWVTLPVLSGFAFAPYLGSLVWSAGGYALVEKFILGCALLGLVLFALTAVSSRYDGAPKTEQT